MKLGQNRTKKRNLLLSWKTKIMKSEVMNQVCKDSKLETFCG